jgi:hypothetical protein
MNKQGLVWACIFTITVSAGACLPNDRLLVGGNGGSNGNDGGGNSSDTITGGQDTGVVDEDPTISRRVRLLKITGTQALTRMAGVIWNGPPDADLLSQDSAGHFTTVEDLYGPARQMLADPRATVGVGAFYRWWLDLPAIATLTKDQVLFPEFNPDLAADMAREPETFGVNVTLPMNGTYRQLMTAPFSFINAPLAAIYGVAGVTGTDLRMVALDAQKRAGLLTQPGLLALTSSSTRNTVPGRGTYVSNRILCLQIPAPPANVPPIHAPTPGLTTREALAEHRANPACAACHVAIDPLGLAYETFDPIGHGRTLDNGATVDVSGLSVPSVSMGAVFNGPVELANNIAGDDGAQHCMTRQWLAFALGRQLISGDDRSITQAHSAFRFASFNLKELIANIVLTDAFLAPDASPRPFAP